MSYTICHRHYKLASGDRWCRRDGGGGGAHLLTQHRLIDSFPIATKGELTNAGRDARDHVTPKILQL